MPDFNDHKDRYLNFDDYIRQGEPAQRERADAWRVAIGLQAVDGLTTSEYFHIHPTAEWSVQPNLAAPTNTGQAPNKLPNKLPNKFETDNLYIKRLVAIIGDKEITVKEMMIEAGLKDRVSFLNLYLTPAIKDKYVRMLYPDRPNHPRQKYQLTVKGLALYNELMKRN